MEGERMIPLDDWVFDFVSRGTPCQTVDSLMGNTYEELCANYHLDIENSANHHISILVP